VESFDGCGDDWVMRFTDKSLARFYHDQDCCESVRVEDFVGEPQSLIGKTIAGISLSNDDPPEFSERRYDDSHTWSIFTITTTDGMTVVMRWLGESNGYYGESVYVSEE